jgi:hypothetical protein
LAQLVTVQFCRKDKTRKMNKEQSLAPRRLNIRNPYHPLLLIAMDNWNNLKPPSLCKLFTIIFLFTTLYPCEGMSIRPLNILKCYNVAFDRFQKISAPLKPETALKRGKFYRILEQFILVRQQIEPELFKSVNVLRNNEGLVINNLNINLGLLNNPEISKLPLFADEDLEFLGLDRIIPYIFPAFGDLR